MVYTTTLMGTGPLEVALFGLDRMIPEWVHTNPNDGRVLDLGPGNKLIPGAIRLDWPDWDADRDLLSAYADESVDGIYAINILEHLADPRPLIAEFGRVLRDGAAATIFVPNARCGMYLQDLDHKTPFIIDTFKNFIDPHPYYEKGHEATGLRVGAVFNFGLKEENLGLVAQLIKGETF